MSTRYTAGLVAVFKGTFSFPHRRGWLAHGTWESCPIHSAVARNRLLAVVLPGSIWVLSVGLTTGIYLEASPICSSQNWSLDRGLEVVRALGEGKQTYARGTKGSCFVMFIDWHLSVVSAISGGSTSTLRQILGAGLAPLLQERESPGRALLVWVTVAFCGTVSRRAHFCEGKRQGI